MLKYKTAVSRVQPAELKSAAGQNQRQLESSCQNLSQPQDESTSAVIRIQPPKFQSVVGLSQLQLVSSRQSSSQPWDGVGRNSHPAAVTRVRRRIESAATFIQPPELETAATRIQPPELELAAGQNQPELVFSRISEIDISIGTLDFNKCNYVYMYINLNFIIFSHKQLMLVEFK